MEEDYYYRNVMPQRDTAGSVFFFCIWKGGCIVCGIVRRVFSPQNVRRSIVFEQQRACMWLCSADTRLLLSSSQWQLERLHDHEAFCCWQPAVRLHREETLTTQRRASHSSNSSVPKYTQHCARRVISDDHPYPVCVFRWLLRWSRCRKWAVWWGRSVAGYWRPPQLLVSSGQRHGVLSVQKCEYSKHHSRLTEEVCYWDLYKLDAPSQTDTKH